MILVPKDVFSLALSGDVNIFAVAAEVCTRIPNKGLERL
jgi:hypothetical protein